MQPLLSQIPSQRQTQILAPQMRQSLEFLQAPMMELRSLIRDPIMLVLIVYAFTLSIYSAATAMPDTLNKAPIAIVNEDRSPLSWRIVSAFYPPHFLPPELITQAEMDAAHAKMKAAKAAEGKCGEGKCGEGKCGGQKKTTP